MRPERLRVLPVRTSRQFHHFLELPYRLHGNLPMWVPPLRRDQRALLDRDRHPFHEHAQVEYFLAVRARRVVGRIAAIENFAHNRFHGERAAFFGFLDAESDADVFRALLAAAENWARTKGLTVLRGPCSFSTNEECGLLVEGFASPPVLLTPWNPETYPSLVEAAGYTKARDLYSYWSTRHTYDPRMERLVEIVRRRFGRAGEEITTRGLHMSRFAEELETVRCIYNSAWERNWGFVPMTESEIAHMARELKPLVIPELVRFVEVNGRAVAFSLCLPDYNVALRHMEGKLGPAQLLYFLYMKRRIHQCRVLTLGVTREFRGRGLEALLVADVVRENWARGINSAELGWILEDNAPMNRELINIGAQHYKTHRIYEKTLEVGG